MEKIAILLGAGSSVAAGFPTTNELTSLVLSGQGVTRGDDGAYDVGDTDEPSPVVLKLVKSMVRRLHAEAERYYSAYARRPNYEDIYYLALQALDEETGNMENPAVRVFVNELKADMSPLVKTANEENEDPNEQPEYVPSDLTNLLMQTCNYIADVVSKHLISHCPTPESMRQLGVIEDACNSFKVNSISTLCHDTHVETFLNSKGVALSDGFSKTQPDSPPHWNGHLVSDGMTPFLKLHGSVDWFHYPNRQIIKVPPDDYPHLMIIDGGVQHSEDGRPRCLIGTHNKITEYSSGIFRELHYRFRSTITDARRLVICGYSFGDKGINGEIVDWVHGKEEQRLVIIHPNPDSLVENARGAIQKNWDKWKQNGSIQIIRRRFECVDIDDLKKAICP